MSDGRLCVPVLEIPVLKISVLVNKDNVYHFQNSKFIITLFQKSIVHVFYTAASTTLQYFTLITSLCGYIHANI